jgi:uncharacterized protein (UPF0276 family)
VNDLQALPELGVGFIYWPSLDGLLSHQEQLIDVLEVEPQPFWFQPNPDTGNYQLDTQVFAKLCSLPQRKLVHGVGFPIGGTVAPDPKQVAAFVESISVLGAPWASEHLSFSRIHEGTSDVDVGFLLPPVQSRQGAAVAVAHIRALQARLAVPFAFETGVSYLKPMHGELSDGQYFASVAQEADCGILLDLHNLWANERNGRQPVLELIDELPLERVIELHLAGGQEYEGYWVDAHSGLIPPALMDLARRIVPRLPNLKAIIFEIMPQYVVAYDISTDQLFNQFWDLRNLWDMRGRDCLRRDAMPVPRLSDHPGESESSIPSPLEWEDALGAVVTSYHWSASDLVNDLQSDGGTAVLRTLISAARAGKIADTLTLTTRLMLLTLGERRMEHVLNEFWLSKPSEQMASNEARQFAAHVTASALKTEVPYLSDVTSFELAAHTAVMTGAPQNVRFSVDPVTLLSALRRGHIPPSLPTGDFELTVSPPAR